MASGLETSTEAVVHRVWAKRLHVTPAAFEQAQPVFVHRPDMTAVVVIQLDRTVVVAAPERALSRLRPLGLKQLVDVGSLLAALESLKPTLFGAAS